MTAEIQRILGDVTAQADMYVYDAGTLTWIPWDGTVTTAPATAGTAVLTTVLADVVSQQALAINAARLDALFLNTSNRTARIKLGATASAASQSFYILPGGQDSLSAHLGLASYPGRVDVIWDASAPTGALIITELTP